MQMALFKGRGATRIDREFARLERHPLAGEAWVEYVPMWLSGHEALFDELMSTVAWRRTTQHLFERTVETPRRIASFPDDGPPPAVLAEIADALACRYRVRFDRWSAALYRDGQDSVAWHRDREHRDRERAIIAIVSVGVPRRFSLRPYRGSTTFPNVAVKAEGRMCNYSLGWGDLLVMGGTAQRTWEHAVPKVPAADPRISLMFRHHPDALAAA